MKDTSPISSSPPALSLHSLRSVKAVISDWCSLKPDRVLDSELDSIIKKMINMKCCQLPGSDNVVEELLSDVDRKSVV